ncbi:MAG: hypothetical protein U1F76_14450 [Candidatus Competibacteraceae bacterium]
MAQTTARPFIDYAQPVRAGAWPSRKDRLNSVWTTMLTVLHGLMKAAVLLATGVLFFHLTLNKAVPWIVLLLGVLAIATRRFRGLLPVLLRLVATLLRVVNVLWLVGAGGMLSYLAVRHAVDPGTGLALHPGTLLLFVMISGALEIARTVVLWPLGATRNWPGRWLIWKKWNYRWNEGRSRLKDDWLAETKIRTDRWRTDRDDSRCNKLDQYSWNKHNDDLRTSPVYAWYYGNIWHGSRLDSSRRLR